MPIRPSGKETKEGKKFSVADGVTSASSKSTNIQLAIAGLISVHQIHPNANSLCLSKVLLSVSRRKAPLHPLPLSLSHPEVPTYGHSEWGIHP